MRKAERSFTGTPAENRAIQAGIRATNAALNQGKSKAEAKKIGADAADKAMKGSRSKFNRRFTMLAASAIGGGGLALAGRGLGAAGKALVKTLRSQKGASAKKGLDVSQKAVKKRLEQQRKQRIADRLKEDKLPSKDKKPKKLQRVKKVVKVALGQGEKGRRSGVALRDKKTGKLEGVSKKDQAIAKNLRTAAKGAAATAGIAGLTTIAKKPKKEAQATPSSNSPTPKRKPKPPTGTKVDYSPSRAIPKMDKPKAKPKDEAMSMGEYLEGAVGMRGAKGLEGAKRKVKTPLGTLTFDTSDKAFEEEVENKAGGRIKRQAGGKVRGVGQAIKGFGKATYSDKMF
jgi:hypothetical protein